MHDEHEKLEVVAHVPSEPEAAIVVGRLRAHNIKAVAEGALTSGMRAEAPGEVRVLVRAGDLDQAREVLDQIEADLADDAGDAAQDASPWTCQTCTHMIEPEFDQCWHCGTFRDGTPDPQFERAVAHSANPACNYCGYSLVGLTKDRCPECGTAFDRAKTDTPGI